MTRSRRLKITGVALAIAAAAFAILLVIAHRPAIASVERPDPRSFEPALVARGANLARIGNCVSCHQSEGGRPYAGGYPINTPFGTIYGSNITPDPGTGIGRWSRAAFARAMREGVGRDGSHLYPAFPYTHYAGVTDGDVDALYAFLMTRPAVRATPPNNDLIPPLSFRPLLAGWKLLFFRPAPVRADPSQSAEWNRGRYLGETLAHCSACHSPRGLLQQEKRGAETYAGGWSGGWYAPPINARSPAVRAWTPQRLETYLRTGLSRDHAAAAGPMGPVTYNLARADPADVRALARYYAWWMRDAPAAKVEPPLPDRRALAERQHPAGARLYEGACATCHEPGAPMVVAGRPVLPLGTPLHEDNPRDTIQIILQGLRPPVEASGPYMPAYADALTDRQIAEIIRYLKARHGSGPAWKDLENEVAEAREEGR
ncbi:cytochrome c [Sphingomonas carotinifaciens]|uniref:Cytochrome c, mono-and diheme variants n=1 Tax=Sphingomonas carotinifaciens TaxID=1166323 RepID=A0A1G7S351_9SPHN|nr:cytochrome c [Sphingomonas carotinifaciens]MBB4088156.1 nicotinate dehydrogenase subunit B [Sphingomonas carotinifaciens]SDG17413.1 Cytochrome c, mono-and diheme variants [Sphingomonas carotinifaciens]